MLPDSSPSDPFDLDPSTNPDAQEALSRNYSNACVLLLPLRSGRFAIIDRGYNLHAILSDPPSANELRAYSLAFATTLSTSPQVFRKLSLSEPIPVIDLKLDLDLEI